MHPAKIVIVILNWNGCRDTLECLASLEKIDYPYFSTLVIDNGSSDASVAEIQAHFPKVKVLQNQTNLGFAEGNNIGIRSALAEGAEFVLLLNNDTVVDPQILSAFAEGMRMHPEAGILGAKNYLYAQKDTLDHLGGKWNPREGSFDLIGNRAVDDGKSWEEMQLIDYVCGCSFFVRREVFESVGLLEPRYFLIWEESDFCFRAKSKGFLTMTCPQAKLWHKVSVSFVGGKPHSTYFWWRNRLLWIERHCSAREKLSLAVRILLPDIMHTAKLRLLKTIQYFLQRAFRPNKPLDALSSKLLKYDAILCGTRDYLLRRFGNGPDWIYRNPNGFMLE